MFQFFDHGQTPAVCRAVIVKEAGCYFVTLFRKQAAIMVPWSLLLHLLMDLVQASSWPRNIAQASWPLLLLLLLFLPLQVAHAELDTNFEAHLFFPTQVQFREENKEQDDSRKMTSGG